MRYIDAFNHFFPKRYYDACLETPAGSKDIGKRMRGIPALSDVDLRQSIVESFDNYTQVLSHGLPPMERLWGPDKSPDMAKIANDGLGRGCRQKSKAFRRLVGAVADECAGGGGERSRARAQERRQCRAALHQCQRHSARRAAVPADLRSRSPNPASRSCCIPRAPATCRIFRPRKFPNTRFAACSAGPTRPA